MADVPGPGGKRGTAMGRTWATLLVAVVVGVSSAAWALDPPSTGVVVIHGKWGRPGDQGVGSFAVALQKAGFVVDQPEMPWSGTRLYDRTFDQAMDEIDAAVGRLRASGAKKIVVAGHSLGGSAALRYATLGRPVNAVILIAPAPLPEGSFYRKQLEGDIARAREMVASGHGDDSAQFTDLNSDNRTRSVRFKAAVYLSYNAPDSAAAMTVNAQHVGSAPILWLAPKFDPLTQPNDRLLWPKVPASTPKTRIEVIADHMGAPVAGRDAAVDWLRKLN
jgi:pimeloyl-ACP methyl ester carboxylesterase